MAVMGAIGRSAEVVVNSGWQIAGDFRLDNLADLQRSLGTSISGPAELFLRAWQRWGADCLREFAGDWAFALADPISRQLLLSRDPTGQRPLYYSVDERETRFGSMPSGVAALSGQRLSPNLEYLARALLESPAQDGTAQFEHMMTVLPGETVCLGQGARQTTLYWQPRLTSDPLLDTEYIRAYRDLLDAAVQSRLPKDGSPVAVHLSSGWDSSAVATTAARLVSPPDQLISFTAAPASGFDAAVPRGRIADEASLAAVTARQHSLQHFVVRQTRPLVEIVREETKSSQAPVLSPHNLAWWNEIRERASELGARTLLTAELGNLSLNAGGLPALAMFVAQRNWLGLLRECSAAARRSDVRWRGVLFNAFGHLLPGYIQDQLRRIFLGLPDGPECSFIRPEMRFSPAEARPSANPAEDRLKIIRLNDPGASRMAAIAQDGVQELDIMSDRRLIEFSLALPAEQLIRCGVSRPLARAALSDRVPIEVLESRVRGFQSADWYLRFSQADAQETLEEISSVRKVDDLLNLKALRTAIREWPTGNWNSPEVSARFRFGVSNSLCVGLFVAMAERGAFTA